MRASKIKSIHFRCFSLARQHYHAVKQYVIPAVNVDTAIKYSFRMVISYCQRNIFYLKGLNKLSFSL